MSDTLETDFLDVINERCGEAAAVFMRAAEQAKRLEFQSAASTLSPLARSSVLRDLLNIALDTIRTSNCVAFATMLYDAVTVFHDGQVSVDLAVLSPVEPPVLFTSHDDCVLVNAGEGNLVFDVLHETPVTCADSREDLVSLERVESATVPPGETLIARAGKTIFRLINAENTALVLRLLKYAPQLYTCEYDGNTLAPMRSYIGLPAVQRIQHALRLARELQDRSALEQASRFVAHKAHAVRWAAVQAVASLDARAGRSLLEGMREDSHPRIRRSVEAAIARYSREEL